MAALARVANDYATRPPTARGKKEKKKEQRDWEIKKKKAPGRVNFIACGGKKRNTNLNTKLGLRVISRATLKRR